MDALADMHELFGDRDLVVAREVTKMHEEFCRGRVSELMSQLKTQKVRGEITLVVRGLTVQTPVSDTLMIEAEILRLRSEGMHVKEIAEVLGEQYGYSKKAIYRLTLELGRKASL
jgi:16S rRNA (cytidine1402-2'-O)-methyltransferase